MKNMKRILNVKVIREVDTDPDTSYLGEYSDCATSEFSIDRAHSEDCDSVRPEIRAAKETLEHVQQTIGDLHNAVLAQYNGTLANEKLDAERDELDEAYNTVGELIETIDECDCSHAGHWSGREYRYFNPSFNYVDKHGNLADGNTPEEVRKYVRQDYERMESLNASQWCYIGIHAECEYQLAYGSVIQTLHSGGLWGTESDSEESYLESIEQEELSTLRAELKAIGFSTRAISTAFKNVEHKNE
jgi:hypothetical protein